MKSIEAMYNLDPTELEEVMTKTYQLTAQQLQAIEYAMTLAEFFAHGEPLETEREQIEEDMGLYQAAKQALKQIKTQGVTA